jgi:8-oxo-dGTP pyrophosphatase MutT (NUDIX family)
MLINHRVRNYFAERLRRLTGAPPCRVQVAALPWRKGPNGVEVLLITSRDTGRWVIPKGWPEAKETLFEAAAREAGEEAGIGGAIESQEIGRYYYDKQLASGDETRCEVLVFPMEIDRIADKWPERKKRTREWFAAAEAATRVRERDLGELIAGFGGNPRRSVA